MTITISAGLGLLFTILIGARWRASMWQPAAATVAAAAYDGGHLAGGKRP